MVPRQGEQWALALPRLPMSTDELKAPPMQCELEDERRAFRRLAELGSSFVGIIVYLNLTITLFMEAFAVLLGERGLQVDLARVSEATRRKIRTMGKAYHVKRPGTLLFFEGPFPVYA